MRFLQKNVVLPKLGFLRITKNVYYFTGHNPPAAYALARGEICRLDNRVVEIYTFFHFGSRFFQMGYFFIRQQIQDIPPFHWLAPATHESFWDKFEAYIFH